VKPNGVVEAVFSRLDDCHQNLVFKLFEEKGRRPIFHFNHLGYYASCGVVLVKAAPVKNSRDEV